MLPAVHRLRRRQDFTYAVRAGRRAGRPSLVLHVVGVPRGGAQRHPAPVSDEPARVGFVVSKAVGPAVVRNRVKRRLRYLMAERVSQLPPGALVVVRALPSAATSTTEALRSDVDAAMRRLGCQPPRNPDAGGP